MAYHPRIGGITVRGGAVTLPNVNTLDDPVTMDAALWTAPEIRAALGTRDIGTLYRLLGRRGVSQRRIAIATGQSQPEVSAIVKGRVVMAYDLLARIADGLGVPRGLMGLAHTEDTTDPSGTDGTHGEQGPEGDEMRRRNFLALVARTAMVGLTAAELAGLAAAPSAVAVPDRVGMVDVEALTMMTRHFRALDDRCGGGMVKSAMDGHLAWATRLLDTPTTDAEVARAVREALADGHSLAGWVAFDLGAHDQADRHLVTALALARQVDNPALAAKILFQTGRVHLHRGHPVDALRIFGLGLTQALEARDHRATALMHLNSAWANAELGRGDQAGSLLRRARDELARDSDPNPPEWLRFVDSREVDGIAGMTWTALSARDRAHADAAIEHATRSHDARDPSDTRSRLSDLIAVAANHYRAGNPDTGADTAERVLELLPTVRSTRMRDRLAWVGDAAALYPSSGRAREITERVALVRAA